MPKKPKSKIQHINTIISNPDKGIPKFCTSVNFAVLESKHIILSFTFGESSEQPQNSIERIIIDSKHAKKINEVLSDLIDKMEEK